MGKTVLHIFCFFILFSATAQNDLTKKSLYNTTYLPADVIDEKYGIVRYEKLNMLLGGDTVRNKNGYAANGFIQDYYTSGKLLHKGFYLDGQLKIYKNYYPNGQVERNFRMVDLKKGKMDIFYTDGTKKSKMFYIDGEAQKWEDFFKDGTLEYIEVYDKSISYYVDKRNFYEDGTAESALVLESKRKMIYTQTYFYKNGQVKEEGGMQYDKSMFDYLRIGTWKYFDSAGSLNKEVKYVNGEVFSEKEF
jgi:antitoxin component YwqK of YwqJK toxin-antitoxin module